MAHVVLHPNFDNLVESMPNSRIIAFTAHATKTDTEVEYKPTDILLFEPEPGDIPDPMDIMAARTWPSRCDCRCARACAA